MLAARARHGLDWKLRLIFPSQIRAARALLGLNQETLAAGAGIGSATLKRIEATPQIRGAADTLWKIEQTLEAAGIKFLSAEGQKGLGVRLRSR